MLDAGMVLGPYYCVFIQLEARMKNKISFAASVATGAMLGAIVPAALDEPPMVSPIASIGAEAAPGDEQHEKHAHHHDDTEGQRVAGSGGVALPALAVNGSDVAPGEEQHGHHARHHNHTPEDERESPDVQVALTGQTINTEQGTITPATAVSANHPRI